MKAHRLITGLLLVLTISGCTTSEQAQQITLPAEAYSERHIVLIEQTALRIADFETLVNQHTALHLSYFSPSNMRTVTSAVARAKTLYQSNIDRLAGTQVSNDKVNRLAYKTFKEVDGLIVSAEQSLQRALATAEASNTMLSDAIERQRYLQQLDSNDHFRAERQQLTQQLKVMTNELDAGKINQVKRKFPAFIARMQSLESKMLIKQRLTPIDKTLDKLKTAGLQRRLPRVFDDLETARNGLYHLLRTRPRDQQAIELATYNIEFQRQRLTHLDSEYLQLLRYRPRQLENYLLSQEQRLQQLSDVISGEDLRSSAFVQQVSHMLKQLQQQAAENNAQFDDTRAATDNANSANNSPPQDLESLTLRRNELIIALAATEAALQQLQQTTQPRTKTRG